MTKLPFALLAAALLTPAARAGAPPGFDPKSVAQYDAVVVTVCGLEFADLQKAILDRLFDKDAAKTAAASARLRGLLGATAPSKADDAYLERALTARLAAAGRHDLVVPLPWSRDPEQTAATEADFESWLPQIYAAAAAAHKPVYVVAHSWGTVLMHDVLTALAAQGSPVRVDRFVSLGSPLVPSNGLVKLFDGLELPSKDFGALAAKPANTAVWRNFWGARDVFSNAIPKADANYRVDGGADGDAGLLRLAVLDPALDAQALADLATLDNFSLWHSSYYAGYDAYFQVLRARLDLDIPDTLVVPESL